MSKDSQIDLVEFPASSPEELMAIKIFFAEAFNWQYKDYGDGYSDTPDSGLTFGINATNEGQSSMPLVVIYASNLEAAKEKVVQAGGKIIVDTYPFPGGRRFHFIDPAGHEFAVWSEESSANNQE